MSKQKSRDKVAETTTSKHLEFTDKEGKPGSCQVTLPAERFSYIITRRVAENLLTKHGDNLPFDVMGPPTDAEDDDWVGITTDDLTNGKLDKDRTQFEIWMPLESNMD